MLANQMIRFLTNKFFLIGINSFLLGYCQISFAQTPTTVSSAVYFATQAGSIAGLAGSCCQLNSINCIQPVSVMQSRTNEVIDALATNPTDKSAAQTAFQAAQQTSQAQASTVTSQQAICSQAIAAYNGLPLLKPDYQQAVVNKLAASNKSVLASTSSPTATSAAPQLPLPPSAAVPTTVNAAPAALPPLAPANPLYPALSTPAQNYVASANNPQNTANVAAINPGYNDANQNTEIARLKLAEQLIGVAQSLVSNTGQHPVTMGTMGQPSQYNPIYNSQLNEKLNGIGANNPIFTGAPLGN